MDFAEAFKRRKILKAGGLELPFIGLEELLINKRATGRPHDLHDAMKLEEGTRRKNAKAKSARRQKGKP